MPGWFLFSGLLSFCQHVVLSAGQSFVLSEWEPVKPHADDLLFEQMSVGHPVSPAGVRLSHCFGALCQRGIALDGFQYMSKHKNAHYKISRLCDAGWPVSEAREKSDVGRICPMYAHYVSGVLRRA